MMIESLVAARRAPGGGRVRERRRGSSTSRSGPCTPGWARGLLPAFFLGEWDSALEMAEAVREAWAAADRPPIAALAAALACAGAILGYRGDEAGSADWFQFAAQRRPRPGGQTSGVAMLRADVDLHRGQAAEAVRLDRGVRSEKSGGARPTRRQGRGARALAATGARTIWPARPRVGRRPPLRPRASCCEPGRPAPGREPASREPRRVRADRVPHPGGPNRLAARQERSARGRADASQPRDDAARRARRQVPLRQLRASARCSASRRRPARVWSIAQAASGCSSTNARNSHAAIPRQRRSVVAVTVAERGPSSSRAISPKWSPGPRVRTISPRMLTVALPSSISQKPAPPRPSSVALCPR